MTILLNFTGTPSLLELVGDEGTFPLSLIAFSLCGDEGADITMTIDLSLCGNEGADVNLRGGEDLQSPCADETTSDVRLKTDIEQVGTTVYGLPLYRFRYKTGPERFQGVMAQDVLQVMPDAVVRGEDGYYRVKYAELGIRMTRA